MNRNLQRNSRFILASALAAVLVGGGAFAVGGLAWITPAQATGHFDVPDGQLGHQYGRTVSVTRPVEGSHPDLGMVTRQLYVERRSRDWSDHGTDREFEYIPVRFEFDGKGGARRLHDKERERLTRREATRYDWVQDYLQVPFWREWWLNNMGYRQPPPSEEVGMRADDARHPPFARPDPRAVGVGLAIIGMEIAVQRARRLPRNTVQGPLTGGDGEGHGDDAGGHD